MKKHIKFIAVLLLFFAMMLAALMEDAYPVCDVDMSEENPMSEKYIDYLEMLK